MFNLGLSQCADLILACGNEVTFLLQGPIGSGKTAIQKTLAAALPSHLPIYFDCTTKDQGDMMLPRIAEATSDAPFVSFAPNEELGLHHRGPIIAMLDEIGKAPKSVQGALTRFMYERKFGSYTLHPDSIVFATTNLAGEGVGDMLMPHHWNRITLLTVRKPDHLEWLEWAINNNLDPALMGWVRDNPHLFQSFEEVKDPEQNPYIFHPRDPSRKSFVTGRSLEKASKIIKATRGKVDETSLTAALIGTLGARAAMDLMAFVSLSHDLPTLESIKTDPLNAKVPTSAAGVCMVVYRTLATIEADWVENWMKYIERLDAEAQALFANGVRSRNYAKQAMIMNAKSFASWVVSRSYLFGADV
jgi:vacuolar-type H+-ATPase catalytic subunit A/Vma1